MPGDRAGLCTFRRWPCVTSMSTASGSRYPILTPASRRSLRRGCLNDNAPLIFEDGLQSRDFTHVSDIVQANMLAMDRDAMNYDYFNVGTGRRLTCLELPTR